MKMATLNVTNSNLFTKVVSLQNQTMELRVKVAAGNPLVRASLQMDLDLTIKIKLLREATLDSSTSRVVWVAVIDGAHDGFPAYELYINREQVYTYMPIGKSPLALLPPLDERVRVQSRACELCKMHSGGRIAS